jgi:hypothetical protein
MEPAEELRADRRKVHFGKGEEVCGFAKGFFDTFKNAKTLIGTLIQRGEMQGYCNGYVQVARLECEEFLVDLILLPCHPGASSSPP